MAQRRRIKFTIAEDEFQLLLMLARTERKSIEDLFRESVPEVVAKYSLLSRFFENGSRVPPANRRKSR